MADIDQGKHAIEVRPTKAFTDQKPGTSGLRKSTKTFKANQYFENFIQAYFNDLAEANKDKQVTLVVGGDGRHFVREGTKIIIQMAAANNVRFVDAHRLPSCIPQRKMANRTTHTSFDLFFS